MLERLRMTLICLRSLSLHLVSLTLDTRRKTKTYQNRYQLYFCVTNYMFRLPRMMDKIGDFRSPILVN